MSLPQLAAQDNWQGFDDAWTEMMTAEQPVDELLEALTIVATKKRISRCVPLLREHANLLEAGERFEDAARVLGAGLRAGGPPADLAAPLIANAERAWADESSLFGLRQLAGLNPDSHDPRGAWVAFDEMRSYTKGTVVHHAAGWGTGEVTDVHTDEFEITVKFQSGRTDRFPLRTAVDIFERLPEEDLRVQFMRDPKELKRRLSKEPLEVLRSILVRQNGKATNITLRNALQNVGVTGSSWSAWWRKVRIQAENSEWFRVTGTAAKAQIKLLHQAADPVESMRRQLRNSTTLSKALTRVRDLLNSKKLEDAVQEVALKTLEEMAANPAHEPEERVATWLLLRDYRPDTPVELTELLAAARDAEKPTDPSVAPELWKHFQAINGVREQERSIELLKEVCGDGWVDEAAAQFAHAPQGMLKALSEELLQNGRQAELAQLYGKLLARPMRAPFALITLAKLDADGRLEGELPGESLRAQSLIELSVHLEQTRRGNALHTRAQQRLSDLLTKGDPPLLRRWLEKAEKSALRSVRLMLSRGVEDRVDSQLTDLLLELAPEELATRAHGFWADEGIIWTTRAGLERRDAELRELVDRKIPENSEAIARAASYGDLSENAEWEQAIADQRQLAAQATTIEQELRKAQLLENAPIPEDTVTPGTAVRYREVESGAERRAAILGPWDVDEQDAVSYLAPLAQGMLGLHPGDRATLALPAGALEIEVLAIEPSNT